MRKAAKILISIILAASVLQTGCSPRYGRSFLSFFFDGVPVRDTLDASGNSIEGNDNPDTFRSEAIVSENGSFVHYPYQEKECFVCHDESSKSELVMKQPDLCYMCHDDFQNVYKYVHGPVASGYCTECHNPHRSDEKYLLTRTGQKICTLCHDLNRILKTETHTDIGETECTLCHNPHGGEDRFILN